MLASSQSVRFQGAAIRSARLTVRVALFPESCCLSGSYGPAPAAPLARTRCLGRRRSPSARRCRVAGCFPVAGQTVGTLGQCAIYLSPPHALAPGLQAKPKAAAVRNVVSMSHAVKIYDTCIGCTQCVRACPTDVLEMVPWDGCRAGQIASAPRTEDCVGCKRCEAACPTDFLSVRVYLGAEVCSSPAHVND